MLLFCSLFTGCEENRDSIPIDLTEITGEIYSTGEFQALVPKGWRSFPVTDPFEEDRPVKSDCFFLNKGGESQWHVFEKPYIRLEHFYPDEQMDVSEPDPELWQNVEEYPSMQFGELIWNGYAADNYHGRAHMGRFAVLWTENDGQKYQALICFRSGGHTISLEDADVQAILASVGLTNTQETADASDTADTLAPTEETDEELER